MSAAAVSWYEKAAAQGSMDARLRLADFYYFGSDGLAKDYQKALPHVKAAATAGNPLAQNLLGTMFEFGHGVDVSRADAMHWFREAALQGNAKAQSNLGRLIRSGDPHGRDAVAVYQWLKLASDQGETTATVMLADLEPSLTAAQKSEAEDRIRKFHETHSRK